jgi:hypothetical protein
MKNTNSGDINNETFSTIIESNAGNTTYTHQGKNPNENMATKKSDIQQNITRDTEQSLKKKPKKKVHPWIWTFVEIFLGVIPQLRENPGIISSVLQILTIGSALSKFYFNLWM